MDAGGRVRAQQYVGGLEVSVDGLVRMGMADRIEHGATWALGLERIGRGGVDQVVEGAAVDERLDPARRAVDVGEVGDDLCEGEPFLEAPFRQATAKTDPRATRALAPREHLQRVGPVEGRVAPAQHDRDAAPTGLLNPSSRSIAALGVLVGSSAVRRMEGDDASAR